MHKLLVVMLAASAALVVAACGETRSQRVITGAAGGAVAGEVLRLCRLRYSGTATMWGFAIYRASHDDYEESFLPTGFMGGTAEDALDTACGLYLGDPTA